MGKDDFPISNTSTWDPDSGELGGQGDRAGPHDHDRGIEDGPRSDDAPDFAIDPVAQAPRRRNSGVECDFCHRLKGAYELSFG